MGCGRNTSPKFGQEDENGGGTSFQRSYTPSPNDKYATIIHGDCKAMNAMMDIEPSTPTIMIDMVSASAGLRMSDVAMHIHHAINPDDLDNGGEESLLEYYLQTLRDLGCEVNTLVILL